MPIDQYVRLKRLAKLLDVHPKTVQRWSREGKFPKPIFVGGEPRWKESEVLVFLEMKRHEPEPEPPPEPEPAPPGAEIPGAEGSKVEHLGTSAKRKPKPG